MARAAADARVEPEPEHDVERATFPQNENCWVDKTFRFR
jgi:hypothetical protein